MVKIVINRNPQTTRYFIENLGNKVQLEMVAIPAGSFMMGSSEDELERQNSESPQHQVTIQPFFMGKYPITQAQWRAIASLEQVSHELKSDPSHFKGENRPVECVSWLDAVEFCKRLSQYTNRPYRLPSEAEWEYACRALTTTPFHFGETIATDLANYRGTDNEEYKWSGSYGRGAKGIYREETTDVGSFGVANAFGLYDMHGQVWEWCADHWHENYEGAPMDGSAWLYNDNDNHRRVMGGGSWLSNPGNCRSASRNYCLLDYDYHDIGFRVACGVLIPSNINTKTGGFKSILVEGVAIINFEKENEDGNIANKTIEITPDDLAWEVSALDERQMGVETTYTATYYFDGGKIEWNVWEYPMGITNYSDYTIEGGTLVGNFDSLTVNNEEPG